jgi:hypothetical protein
MQKKFLTVLVKDFDPVFNIINENKLKICVHMNEILYFCALKYKAYLINFDQISEY